MVANLASALLWNGVEPGDRVASYSSNCIVRFSSSVRISNFSDSLGYEREWSDEYDELLK